ncbi:MAG: hypothetical protein J6M53_02415 [Bacteroidaceae bacterium]|nr:hypothetical protein [Bacteroidaceae bacterium]
MKHIYITPWARPVAFLPEALLETISTEEDERGPQSSRKSDWEEDEATPNNFWN